jgi:hypothetical protein
LSEFENRVLRRIFRPEGEGVTDGENYIMRSFLTVTISESEEGEASGRCSRRGKDFKYIDRPHVLLRTCER